MNTQPFKKYVPVPNLSFSRALKEMGRNSYVDWIVIIFLSFTVAVVLVGGSSYLYFAVTRGNIRFTTTPDPEAAASSFDERKLVEVISTFDQKNAVTEQAKRAFTGITDPSQ